MVALLCFSTCISLPISPVPAALAIDFAVDESVSPQDLPVKAVQRTNENTALVTFTVDLSWKMDGIERVTYTIDADNVKIYAPGIGNYYMANDGELGSTKDAVQSKNGQAALPLNIEVVVPSTEAETNDELCTLAYNALEGKSIIAVAYFHDGSTETSDCLFAR